MSQQTHEDEEQQHDSPTISLLRHERHHDRASDDSDYGRHRRYRKKSVGGAEENTQSDGIREEDSLPSDAVTGVSSTSSRGSRRNRNAFGDLYPPNDRAADSSSEDVDLETDSIGELRDVSQIYGERGRGSIISPEPSAYSDSEVMNLRRVRFHDVIQRHHITSQSHHPNYSDSDSRPEYHAHSSSEFDTGGESFNFATTGKGLKKWIGRGPKSTSGLRIGKRVRARDYIRPYPAAGGPDPFQFLNRVSEERRVSAHCIADGLNIESLYKFIKARSPDTATPSTPNKEAWLGRWRVSSYLGAVHAQLRSEDHNSQEGYSTESRQDVFYFNWGCVVCWSLSEEDEALHVKVARKFKTGPAQKTETDDMMFTYGDRSGVRHDVITITSMDAQEMLSLSFAVAQSVMLDVFESRVEGVIDEYRAIPSNMDKYSLSLSKHQLSKMIGKIFLERCDINLKSDILDEPDFFWESDQWLVPYKALRNYLEVDNRVALLNAKLDILKELVSVLNNQLQERHGVQLEMIIIWLIVASVSCLVFWHILVKDILGLFHHSHKHLITPVSTLS